MAKLPKEPCKPGNWYPCQISNYYGGPYLQKREGQWYLLIDDESRGRNGEDGQIVSEAFATAWIAEFGEYS